MKFFIIAMASERYSGYRRYSAYGRKGYYSRQPRNRYSKGSYKEGKMVRYSTIVIYLIIRDKGGRTKNTHEFDWVGSTGGSLIGCRAQAATTNYDRVYNLTYTLEGNEALEQKNFFLKGIALRMNFMRFARAHGEVGYDKTVGIYVQVVGCTGFNNCGQKAGGDLKVTEGIHSDWTGVLGLPVALRSTTRMSGMVKKWDVSDGGKMYVDKRDIISPTGSANRMYKIWVPINKWIIVESSLSSKLSWNVYLRIGVELLGDGIPMSAMFPAYNYACADFTGVVYYSFN